MRNNKKITLLALLIAISTQVEAAKKFELDETKWGSIGAGLRSSFRAHENTPDWDNSVNLDNLRLYLNGQIHQYLKVEFNTECSSCGRGGDFQVLDAIGKFEFHPMANVWIGRHLVPAERREMNGPFYSAVYNIFQSGTPFEPSDYNTVIKASNSHYENRWCCIKESRA
ncbi:MAG: hypothetical protein WCL34_15240, partial [Methylococcaceae bacterium]